MVSASREITARELNERAPFQIIHVGAAAPEIPQALIDQVSPPSLPYFACLLSPNLTYGAAGKTRTDVHTRRN